MDGYGLARPFLFALGPERAHDLGLSLMRFASKVEADPLPVRTALGPLSNPLGLAAGYDKTGRHLGDLSRLGFGYLVAGTFTLGAQPGNPRPRVARDKEAMTLVNSLGFPNPGVGEFVRRLSGKSLSGVPIVASISGKTLEEVVGCYTRVQPHVAGVEVNLSSPNTPSLRDLREPEAFSSLARELRAKKTRPTYLKTPPYMDETQYEGVLAMMKEWASVGFEGVTASNSIPVEDLRMAVGRGGRSGPPLLDHTKAALRKIRGSLDPAFEVNACGGISSPSDAASLLDLGATTIQIFTALVYQGPSLVRNVLRDDRVRRAVEPRNV